MTVEERIEAADRRRIDGNELFKEGNIEAAMQQYEMALAFMGDDFMFQLFGKYRDMANAVKNPCHLNLAACLLKLNRFEEVIGHCTVVRMPLSTPFQNKLGHSLCANLLIFVVSI
jgi:hypothetical protein